MKEIESHEVKGTEKERLHKRFFVSNETPIHKVTIDGDVVFNFYYTVLDKELWEDLEKILKKDHSRPNSFIYARESFLKALNHLLSKFSSPKNLPCFSKGHSINIFLARDFNEFCSIGSPKKKNLPDFASGRVSGTTLIYIQKRFLEDSKKETISEQAVMGEAHELLHIFFQYNNFDKNGKLATQLPFLFNEGLTVICANQISKKFNEEFVSPEHLFLEPINAFDYDKRWIPKNRYYQSAGQFMDYILKSISKKEKISYEESFQKMFDEISNSKSFDDKGKFDAKKFFNETFNLDVEKEYCLFKKSKKTI